MAKKNVYEHYRDEMINVTTKKNKELEAKRKGLQIAEIKEEKRIEDVKELLISAHKENNAGLMSAFEGDLRKATDELKRIEKDLAEVEQIKVENKDIVLDYEKFLEHFTNMAQLLEKEQSLENLDFILRKIFSNITLKDKEMLSYQLNSPFKEFEEKGFVVFGRAVRSWNFHFSRMKTGQMGHSYPISSQLFS